MVKKLLIRLAVLFCLLFIVGIGGWLWWQDSLSAKDPQDSTSKIFVVNQGEGIRVIANRLKAEGLIKDQIGFFLKVRLMGLSEKIQAGDFRLSPSMDAQTIAEELTHGSLDVWVTLLEGWRVEEIALKLAQELAIPESEFLRYAREGYMFPDTYLLPKNASASAVVQIFADNFDKRVTPQMRQGIAAQGLTFEQGVVLASIVEREGNSDEDRPVIAGILLNRLNDDHPLQVDATLQYVLGYQAQDKTWWKKSLFDEDKKNDSPYNTYKYPGLPPHPIANPGLASIEAVASPTKTDYYYYIHDIKGQVHFAKTLEEHNSNVEKYLQ